MEESDFAVGAALTGVAFLTTVLTTFLDLEAGDLGEGEGGGGGPSAPPSCRLFGSGGGGRGGGGGVGGGRVSDGLGFKWTLKALLTPKSFSFQARNSLL